MDRDTLRLHFLVKEGKPLGTRWWDFPGTTLPHGPRSPRPGRHSTHRTPARRSRPLGSLCFRGFLLFEPKLDLADLVDKLSMTMHSHDP